MLWGTWAAGLVLSAFAATFVAAATLSSEERPTAEAMQEGLQRQLGLVWKIMMFEVEVIEDVGTKVEPNVRFRVRATAESQQDLFKKDREIKGTTFISVQTPKGRSETIYAVGSAEYRAGKWTIRNYTLQNDPITSAGTPRTGFSGRVIDDVFLQRRFIEAITPTKKIQSFRHPSCVGGEIQTELNDVGFTTTGIWGYTLDSPEFYFVHLAKMRKGVVNNMSAAIYTISVDADGVETKDSGRASEAGYTFYGQNGMRETECFNSEAERNSFFDKVLYTYQAWVNRTNPTFPAKY